MSRTLNGLQNPASIAKYRRRTLAAFGPPNSSPIDGYAAEIMAITAAEFAMTVPVVGIFVLVDRDFPLFSSRVSSLYIP